MKRMVFGVVVIGMFLCVACGSNAENSSAQVEATLAPVPPEFAGKTNPFGPEAAEAGGEIFKANCVSCHGPQGHGDGPAAQALDPKPKNLAELQKTAPDDYLFWRIATGRPGTAMVAWQGTLTDEQIWQVIRFLHTLN